MRLWKPGDRVIYIPLHAKGDHKHPDCEHGAISSLNDPVVFVKFDQQVKNLGWEGATAQACDQCNLMWVGLGRIPEPQKLRNHIQ